jgi:predicted transcriptional regulator
VLGEKGLCRMLFEASNEDRLAILMKLDGEAMNVTGLSQALGLTTQEASRHLHRLVEVALIALPKPDGNFDLLVFSSEGEMSHKWCRDLYQHYWERGEL